MTRLTAGLFIWTLFASSPVLAESIPAIASIRDVVGALEFEETFSIPCPVPCDFNASYPRWKTNFYYGNQNDITSRAYPGPRNVMLDARFDRTALTPTSSNGNLYITAYQLPPADVAKYRGRTYASSVVSTEKSFAQAFGYFEISAKLPDSSGTWPAFWLLPATRTPVNAGRLAEIDIFEHFAGPFTVMSGKNPVVIDRAGKPLSTLHYGTSGAEQVLSNWPKNPPAKIDLSKFHTFGLLWTADKMVFFIDQVATLTIANPGVVDPHYIVLSMDVADRAGDPAAGKYPADMIVDYVRAWALR